jgi:hypothetical protein
MVDVYQPDFGRIADAYARHRAAMEQEDANAYRRKLLERDAANESAVRASLPAARGGDANALSRIYAASPETGMRLESHLASLDEQSRQDAKGRAEAIYRELHYIEALPPERQQQGYQESLARLKARGMEFPDAPAQFTPDVAARVRAEITPIAALLKLEDPKAPPTRERYDASGNVIQEELDVNGWREYGRGPRFKPGADEKPLEVRINEAEELAAARARGTSSAAGGSLTAAQRRDNAEIDQARETLDTMNLTREEVANTTREFGPDGYTQNPKYSPFLAGQVRAATQRKVGDDPDYSATYNRYFGTEQPAAAERPIKPPAEAAPAAPVAGGAPSGVPPRGRGQSGRRGGQPTQPRSDFAGLGRDDLRAYVTSRGGEDALSDAEVAAIHARIDELEREAR